MLSKFKIYIKFHCHLPPWTEHVLNKTKRNFWAFNFNDNRIYNNKKKENNKVWHKPKHNHTAKQGCLKRNSANDADDAGENIHKKVLKIKCTKNINKSKNKKKTTANNY